jgi:hypothetical protein
MTFRTEFYRNGEMVGRVLSIGTLDDAIRATNGGMIKHNADVARILDLDKFNLEVHRVKR